jgi:excisionase family DNA binding protein
MTDPAQKPPLALTLTVDELAAVVQDAVKTAMRSAPKDDALLTVEQAARVLNCKPQWLYVNAKKLPFVRKVGGQLRFSSNDLQRWIAAQRLKSARDGGG